MAVCMCMWKFILMGCLIVVVAATPVAEIYTKYEEYEIEHEISSTQAKNTALHMDVNSVKIPVGCETCTKEELAYCLGSGLINDHCCCDKKYKETLLYIPHTCYLGPRLCNTIAENCETYLKVKECCCDKYALQHWKAKASASSFKSKSTSSSLLYSSLLLPALIINFFI